ncbi:MAG TPA: ATP-binding protein [Gemmatimonadaceae bacterium]|nr:ATP-binding protein [Gemmatimonadaceae bacterium]
MQDFTHAADLNPEPVLRTDDRGLITHANPAARELFGDRAAAALEGRAWADVCPAVDAAAWRRIFEGDEPVRIEALVGDRTFDFVHRHAPGTRDVWIFGDERTRLHTAEEVARKSERMSTLGTLAAGVAHELNNPAAAAARGAEQLREAFARLQDASAPLSRLGLSDDRAVALLDLVRQDRDCAATASHIDPLTRSDLELHIESWLEEHGIDEPWDLAPALVSLGYDRSELTRVATEWGDATAAVVRWVARAQPVLALAREIEEATRRISEIVRALKSYSFAGRPAIRTIDVTEGIDNTLVILRSKLKNGITVVREYEPGLPRIEAWSSDLNQVWTNLIDNAADALGGEGRIVLRARTDGEHVTVEIEDDGAGMPESVQQRIFEPFFTTKEPGQGTGLGLTTSRAIVVNGHGGTIDVTSAPGRTKFTVRLPIHVARPADSSVAVAPPD